MSATAPTTRGSSSAASGRLTRAIGAAEGQPSAVSGSDGASPLIRREDPPAPRRRAAGSAEQPPILRDAARGAMAAPGANAAGDGAAQVMGAGQPFGHVAASPASAPTPQEASMAPCAAHAAATADPYAGRSVDPYAAPYVDPYAGRSVDPYAARNVDPSAAPYAAPYEVDPSAPDPIDAPDAPAPVAPGGGWSAAWQREFERLRLASADIEHLARSGYSDADLAAIAGQLAAVDVIEPGRAPVPGVDAGNVSSADGPLPRDGRMAPASAWTPEWEARFSDLMRRMGMSDAQVREQVASIEGQPVTAEQLDVAYRQMESSLGAFDKGWKQKFETLMEELDTPAHERVQVLAQLSSGGLDEAQLREVHAQMEQTKPAWSAEWKMRFRTLGLPEELLTQLAASGAPKPALEQQFQRYLDAKLTYERDGRLEKLEDAKATPEEKWGVMLEGLEGDKFDKAVEQIHSKHVRAWKRGLGIAVNLIPGVYTAQFLTGKDWVTGEKIDRSNPLNIVGAVASGFAGFTAVRSAVGIAGSAGGLFQGLQGARMVNGAVTGGTQMAANAANQAKNASAVLSAATTGSKAGFQLKAVIGSVARMGNVGSIASASRTWGQTASFAASTMAAKNLADGTMAIDDAVRATALDSLRGTGGSVTEAMRATSPARRAFEHGAAFADDAAYARSTAATFTRAGGSWTFNPIKNRATADPAGTGGQGILARVLRRGQPAAATAPPVGAAPVIATGRTLDMGSRAGFAIANGTLDGVTGIRSGMSVADYAARSGINGSFRSLLQLSQSERAATGAVRAAEQGGLVGYEALHVAGRAGRSFATYASVPIIGGAAVGVTGTQMQPMWNWVKDRKQIQAREAEARAVAEQEARELERLYAQQQGNGGAAPATTAPTAGIDAGTATGGTPVGTPAPAAAATAPAGPSIPAGGGEAQVYVDPATGFYVDPQTGMRANPATGEVYDANGQLIGNVHQPAG